MIIVTIAALAAAGVSFFYAQYLNKLLSEATAAEENAHLHRRDVNWVVSISQTGYRAYLVQDTFGNVGAGKSPRTAFKAFVDAVHHNANINDMRFDGCTLRVEWK